jgi:hypothetical protein
MTSKTPTEVTRKSYAYEWYVVAVCMLAYIFSFIDRHILALMIEPIKHDMQLSDTQFNLLHRLAFSLFYDFMGIPIALLADKFSRPKIIAIAIVIAIGIAFWSLATALYGVSKNFLQMFMARIGVGIGEAALSPATYSMLSDMFPRGKTRARRGDLLDRLVHRWRRGLSDWRLRHRLAEEPRQCRGTPPRRNAAMAGDVFSGGTAAHSRCPADCPNHSRPGSQGLEAGCGRKGPCAQHETGIPVPGSAPQDLFLPLPGVFVLRDDAVLHA